MAADNGMLGVWKCLEALSSPPCPGSTRMGLSEPWALWALLPGGPAYLGLLHVAWASPQHGGLRVAGLPTRWLKAVRANEVSLRGL